MIAGPVRQAHAVNVAFDQSRRQRRAGEIDDTRIRRGNVRGGTDRLDLLADDAHGPAFVHRLAIEDTGGTQDDRFGWWRLRRRHSCRNDEEEQRQRLEVRLKPDTTVTSHVRGL